MGGSFGKKRKETESNAEGRKWRGRTDE